MRMNKTTICLQVLSSFFLVVAYVKHEGTFSLKANLSNGGSLRMERGWMRELEEQQQTKNTMQKRWGQQVFTRYNPDDFVSTREKWKRGFDQLEIKKPEKPTIPSFSKNPLTQTPPSGPFRPTWSRPRPQTPSYGVNQRPIMWIPIHSPRFSSYRDRLAMKNVILEVGLGAKIKV